MRHADVTFEFARCTGILIAGCCIIFPDSAFAWGASGHRMIAEIAARELPDELPAFLRTANAALRIGELAREPDRSRGAGNPHDADADPGHFVDVSDNLTVLGGPLLSNLPNTREEYDTALRAAGSDEFRAGYLPYSIIDGWQQLVTDFAYWRADVAAEKVSRTPADREWLANDRALREILTTRDLGYWAHFVGDGSQPMHVSIHFNGWGDYSNPDAFSTDKGLHARFEGAYVRTWAKEPELKSKLTPYRDCHCTIKSRVQDYLISTQKQVVPLYRLEKLHDFDIQNETGKSFVVERLAAGASELRDMIMDAWNKSGGASVGYPPIAVQEIVSGKADALDSLRGMD